MHEQNQKFKKEIETIKNNTPRNPRAEETMNEEFNRASTTDSVKEKKESVNSKANHLKLPSQRRKKEQRMKELRKLRELMG